MAVWVRSFLICDEARAQSDMEKFDLMGAGLAIIHAPSTGVAQPKVFRCTFWAYLQLQALGSSTAGGGRLALMRADSGRRYYFREMAIQLADRLHPTNVVVRMRDCEFPGPGVYFVEFWYDDLWLTDYRIEVG